MNKSGIRDKPEIFEIARFSAVTAWKYAKKKKWGKKKESGLVIRSLKSHRISAYRFLLIGEGRAVGKIEANGKKEGGKRAKAISNGPSGGKRSRANSDLEKLKL